MRTGFRGTFVISWAQTELDGVRGAAPETLAVGASWRWQGEAVRVDGPRGVMVLDGAKGDGDIRRRAAQSVHRLVGAALGTPGGPMAPGDPTEQALDRGFVVTDGLNSYTVTEIDTPNGRPPLLMFVDSLPPPNSEMWVVRRLAETTRTHRTGDMERGVICFVQGTRITTPAGPVPVECLRPGDRVDTMDDGVQEILWVGKRRMSGARLYAMPHLRPVRIREGALGTGRPEGDLLVSPQHRVLLRGPQADLLFNSSEVLVAAGDLRNDRSITYDYSLREVTYVHLMLERHQVLFANGVETESFHPANTELDSIQEAQRGSLLELFPQIADDPFSYGAPARRSLTGSEAAILVHETGLAH
ncbi:Hint domain-containing protein [Rhodovulum adriaticum]|uniref:Hint domain-containing protein n=1 Tax=Rhodovulum adriaticum TaxID=35804 RepID=A0A4V2SL76_RHOAD|nr:Hint domain-containing protein [Rhodovulum adriaticum]MBK1635183.1 hemolysin-type calcium-binding protein [Rhodovulum adriaticum]TCP22296.1 Hint domain-containing protein [Rhodovulum adriaticum]